MFDIQVIEQVAFMYLRSISFNSVIAIIQSWFNQTVLSKDILIDHIEQLSEKIPDNSQITEWLQPKESGYYALDGTYLKYRGREFVLLVLFDVVTLDIVNWEIAIDETEKSYTKLLKNAYTEYYEGAKGFFCDGDPGLLKALKKLFPNVPIQLCVFHKYSRVGQIIPFRRIRTEIDREIKHKVEAVLFALSKEDAIRSLKELKEYANNNKQNKKLQELIGILKRNFDLLLTHFDNPEMSPYNNVLEGFNYIVKRKTKLMKGFKKPVNIKRWINLIMLDWRFHKLNESEYKVRRNKSPLELAGCELPKIYNWMRFVRENYNASST
jgi:transposase-like protein